MVRAGDASRNTVFSSPQGWVGEIVSQVRTGGFLTFEYHMWRDQKSKDNGEAPFLLNNHKAQMRETHQRIRVDTDGKLLHIGDGVTPVAVTVPDVEAFFASDARVYRWAERSRLDEWSDASGRKLQPFVFPAYAGTDEALDPQWLRETHSLSDAEQVEAAILAFLARAEMHGWVGDRRGTTLNLQVGASGGDGLYNAAVSGGAGTAVVPTATTAAVGCTSGGAGTSQDTWALFTGVSGLSGATINSAVYALKGGGSDQGTPLTAVYANDTASPAAPTSIAEYDALARTTANVTWDSPGLTTAGFTNSPSITTVIQELADSLDPSAIQILHVDTRDTDTANRCLPAQYDAASADAPKLDIDYTAGGGGDPEGSLIRGKLIRGGLLRGGVLVG